MKRLIFTVFLILTCSAYAVAVDTAFVSYCRNSTPPSLLVKKFGRSSSGTAYAVQATASKVLTKTCGVTDVQHQGTGQLHVYYTETSGTKVRAIRETIDLATFQFVAGATKTFPANMAAHLNFDTNDAQSIALKLATNKQLHSRVITSAGNLAGGFKPRGKTPATPFNSHISNGTPFFTTSLWTDPASGRTGVTFQNFLAPANATSFLFTNPVFAHDTTLTFPRPKANATRTTDDGFEIFWIALYELFPDDDAPGAAPGAALTTTCAPSIRRIQRDPFAPVENVVKLDKQRACESSNLIAFNGISIDPLGTLIAYTRQNPGCGSNELVIQTFNPDKGKKIAGPKIAEKCDRSAVIFGLSVLNDKFKNGDPD